MWYWKWHPVALALAGRHDDAIALIGRAVSANAATTDAWYLFEIEPACEGLRADPRFIEMSAAVRRRLQAERREIERLRAAGIIPERDAGELGPPAATRRASAAP